MNLPKQFNRIYIDTCKFLHVNPRFGYPYKMMLEPTTKCNLKCPLCPTGNGELSDLTGFMAWEMFVQIADELSPFLFDTLIWGFGEPLLHPRIYDMVKYLSDRDVRTFISTNGHSIKSTKTAYNIVNSNLTELTFAIDGATNETYRKYRQGGDLNTVLNAIKLVKQAKEELSATHPRIRIQFIVMKHNEHEIEAITTIAKELDVKLKLKSVSISNDAIEFLPEKSTVRRYILKENRLVRKDEQPKVCPYPWIWATVNWDGSVVPCCKDPLRDHLIGFVDKNKKFRDVWKSYNYTRFRDQHIKDKSKLKKCKNCVLPK